MMDKETELYYDDLLEMFNQEGWNNFIKDLNNMNKSLIESSPTACETNDQWQYRRGQLEILNYMINYEALMNNALDELESNVKH